MNVKRLSGIIARTTAVLLLLAAASRASLDPAKAITQYTHDVWQTEQGLPQNTVPAIIQTRDGYIWFGTELGLARFDGVRFTVFDKSNTPAMKSTIVIALVEGRDGSLWIGTQGGGLLRLKNGRFTAYSTADGLSSNVVAALYEDRQGNLWIGTDGGGLNRLKDGRFSVYTTKTGLSDDAVFSIFEDRQNTLWVGTHAGLNRLKNGVFATYTTKDGLGSDYIRSVYQDRAGTVWVGTNGGGLSRLSSGGFTTYTTQDGLSSNAVLSMFEDSQGSLWIGTAGGGLNRFRDGKFSAYTSKEGLSSDDVWSFLEDREGSLWVGTGGGGLNRFKDGRFTTYTSREGLSSDVVLPVFEAHDGSLWLGTAGGGLNRMKDGKITSYTSKNGLSHDFVFSVSEDREGSLWIGTRKGLDRLKNGKFSVYTTSQGLPNNIVLVTYVDREGNLWIGTRGGLSRFQEGKFTTYTTKDGMSNDNVLSIYEDKLGALWVGTGGGGLDRFKDGEFTIYSSKQGLSSDVILSIHEDVEGTLWIGTNGGGLDRFRDGHFTAYTTRQGLFDDAVSQILEDDDGYLWLSCDKGVFRVSKKQLNDFAAGKSETIAFTAYDTSDGMKSKECNGGFQPAGWKTKDGRLCFPTMKGVAIVDPGKYAGNKVPPPVLIEKIGVRGRLLDPSATSQLPPGNGQLDFYYTALSFLSPEKVRFKYKLEGFDKDWVDAGARRVAYYTNLPPGHYQFRVIAGNGDGLWNENGAACDLFLTPHFYQTGWFYAFCTLGVIALLAGVYRLRIRALAMREKELSSRVDERTKELRQEIVERQRVEAALRESEERFRQIAENVHEVFWMVDLQKDQILYVSPAYEETWGRSRQGLYENPSSWLDSVHPDDRELALAHSGRAARGLQSEAEYRVNRPDGTVRWIWDRAFPILNEAGQLCRIVDIAEDITVRKASEEALQKAKEAAEAASRAKSEFLANMSHEIRTPLNGILGMTELVLDTPLNNEQGEYLAMARDSAGSLLTIINDILDFSKIEAGKMELYPIEFNLREAFEETARMFSVRAHDKGLELACEIHTEAPETVFADPTRLRQIVVNLVGNAVKFTERGEVVIHVEKESANEEEALLHVTVSDTGIGIPAEKQGMIFQSFTQADGSTTRSFGGTGLGLTISSRLVAMMGGRIWVQSEPGRGSQFHFLANVGVVKNGRPSQPAEVATLVGLRVLVVDDNTTNQRILRDMLVRWGMKPVLADNAEAALASLRAAKQAGEPFALVLTDAHMPDKDGFALAEEVRQNPELAGALVMMLTSGPRHGDGARCRALGLASYLTKPVRQSELREALLRVLGGRDQNAPMLVTRHSLHGDQPALRILLAEDNTVNQRLAARLLEKRGHKVSVVSDGRQALAAIEREKFDAVLMDVQMPQMDGFEATAAIRAKEIITGEHLPIIAMTAHAMKGDRERCIEGGMDGYVSKPIQAAELLQTIAKTYEACSAAKNRSVTEPVS